MSAERPRRTLRKGTRQPIPDPMRGEASPVGGQTPPHEVLIVRDGTRGRQRMLRMNRAATFSMAAAVNAALAGFRHADVTVYDAHGTPIAIIDGESRVRRPIPTKETSA